jgi:hypothetical protein
MRWGWMVLALGACHKDFCERDEQYDVDCGRPHSKDGTKTCKDALDACTKDDVKLIERYQDCYEDAGAHLCEPTDEAYVASLDCLVELDDLSDACVLTQGDWIGL